MLRRLTSGASGSRRPCAEAGADNGGPGAPVRSAEDPGSRAFSGQMPAAAFLPCPFGKREKRGLFPRRRSAARLYVSRAVCGRLGCAAPPPCDAAAPGCVGPPSRACAARRPCPGRSPCTRRPADSIGGRGCGPPRDGGTKGTARPPALPSLCATPGSPSGCSPRPPPRLRTGCAFAQIPGKPG